jgi:myosin heavy subunit
LEVASIVTDDEFASALSQDMLLLSENNLTNTDDTIIIDKGGNKKMGKENEKELSGITDNDLYTRVRRAVNSTSDDWFYIAMLYPYDFRVIAYQWDRESEEDFIEFIYIVNSDDTISITSQKEVKMVFLAKEEIDTQVSELETKLSETEKEVAEAGKSLTELSKEKEKLETQVSELNKYKEKVEELEAAEKEKELSEKKEELKNVALEDNLITSEELESDEQLVTLFSELSLENYETSQEKIELIKGKRAIAKFKESKLASQETIETSEVKTTAKVKTDLNNGDADGVLTAKDVVMSMLSKR